MFQIVFATLKGFDAILRDIFVVHWTTLDLSYDLKNVSFCCILGANLNMNTWSDDIIRHCLRTHHCILMSIHWYIDVSSIHHFVILSTKHHGKLIKCRMLVSSNFWWIRFSSVMGKQLEASAQRWAASEAVRRPPLLQLGFLLFFLPTFHLHLRTYPTQSNKP